MTTNDTTTTTTEPVTEIIPINGPAAIVPAGDVPATPAHGVCFQTNGPTLFEGQFIELFNGEPSTGTTRDLIPCGPNTPFDNGGYVGAGVEQAGVLAADVQTGTAAVSPLGLPETGLDNSGLMVGGSLLILAGAAMVGVTRLARVGLVK